MEDINLQQRKLKYEKWNDCENVIIIDLHNNYSVVAIWAQNEQEFKVTLHLKENTMDRWDLIVDDWKFTSYNSGINSAILKQVSENLSNGFFNEFIERDTYYIKCSEIGCNVLDKERLGDNDV